MVCFFDLPVGDAARILGVCRDSLRRIREWSGTTQWPYDALRSCGLKALAQHIRERRRQLIQEATDPALLGVLQEAERFAEAYWRCREPVGGGSALQSFTTRRAPVKISIQSQAAPGKATDGNSTQKNSTDRISTQSGSTAQKATDRISTQNSTDRISTQSGSTAQKATDRISTQNSTDRISTQNSTARIPTQTSTVTQNHSIPDPPSAFLAPSYVALTVQEIQSLETLTQVILSVRPQTAPIPAPPRAEGIPPGLAQWADSFFAD
jgi:cobalamin biosynthesis Mg chelatase CobN